MKQKPILTIWQSLDHEGKNKLAELSISTYKSMSVLVNRGHIGVKMQHVIYKALVEMGLVDAKLKPETAKRHLFGGDGEK